MIPRTRQVTDCIHGATANALVLDDQAWKSRIERISKLPRSRLAISTACAIHAIARAFPEFIYDKLTQPFSSKGYEVIGIGGRSTVLRMGDTALKLIRASSSMSGQQQEELVRRLQHEQSILTDFLGPYAIEQDFDIAPHPIHKTDIVVAKQPVVENFRPLEFKNSNSLVGLSNSEVDCIDQFAQRSINMTETSGYTPDLLGSNNFGFNHLGRFVIIDTVPLSMDSAVDASRHYLSHLSSEITAIKSE